MQRQIFGVFHIVFAAFLIAGALGAALKPLAAAEKPIELSAGVALPQNLPNGPVMSFGAHYQFKQGSPTAEQYFFVIERSHGTPAKQPVKLKKDGMVAVVVPGWKPEHAPFYGHIEDRQGNELSNTIELLAVGE